MTSLPSQFQPIGHRTYPRRRLGARLAQLTALSVYETPADRTARIDKMFLCSVHTGNATVRVHHLKPGETASTSNALFYDLQLSAKTTQTIDATLWMSPGDKLVIIGGTADHICVTVYGEEL